MAWAPGSGWECLIGSRILDETEIDALGRINQSSRIGHHADLKGSSPDCS